VRQTFWETSKRVCRSGHIERVERSRREILDAIGEPPDLVFVRGSEGLGAELIRAGTRELLRDRAFREIDVEELPSASGHTGLVCGGGGFCRPSHELMPHVLAVAEMRFERVVLLPTTFDASVDEVRRALENTQAVVFAREQESYKQIQPLCDARLAHDCSFFFDYVPYLHRGSGILQAFRTDAESAGELPIPPDNDDISLTAGTLDHWLKEIASHELIRTNRAQVLVAGALLGKAVEFVSSSDFKLPAIADYALSEFPVTAIPTMTSPARPRPQLASSPCSRQGEALRERLRASAEINQPPSATRLRDATGVPRVTAVILSHERPEMVLRAVQSVCAQRIPVDILVVDNNSGARTRSMLGEAYGRDHPRIRVHLSDRNLGCAGGRRLGVNLVNSEFVLFLDDDAELMPGALEHMVSELDDHTNIEAVSALVVIPDGRVSHSGGIYSESAKMASFTLGSSGLPFGDERIPPSGPCDWIVGTAPLVRTSLLHQFPFDADMRAYYDDNEWSYRVRRARPDCFRRSRDALVLHHAGDGPWGRTDFAGRAQLVSFIRTAAYFYRKHGLLLRVPGLDVFAAMPELTRTDETLDTRGARLVMELANTHSADWLLLEWMAGNLDPILGVERTELGNRLHDCQLALTALRADLSEARSDLEDVKRQALAAAQPARRRSRILKGKA
jgi:GT2 family glycosyltransferase